MIKVFYSYAREDQQDIDLLIRRYTARLARSGRIEHWLDRYLHAGDEWERTIKERLEEADVIVLLLSADFFASDFISTVELPFALQKHSEGTAKVIPVLLRKVLAGDRKRIDHLLIVPKDPIYGSRPENYDAWVDVGEEFVHAVDELSGLLGYPDDVAEDFHRCYQKFGYRLGRARVTVADRKEQQSRRKTVGYRWPFGKVAVYRSVIADIHHVHPVFEGIEAAYRQADGCTGDLGFPLSDSKRAAPSRWGSTGRLQRFEGLEDIGWNDPDCGPYGASIYWRENDKTTAAVTGPIGREYERVSGTDGCLGFPISAASPITSSHGTQGRQQEFEGGSIFWCDANGAQVVTAPLHDTFQRLGGPTGRFGLPIGPEQEIGSELQQEFEGGVITIGGRQPSARPLHTRSVLAGLPLTSVTAGSFRSGHQEIFIALRDRRIVNQWNYGDGWSVWGDGWVGEDIVIAMTCCSSAEDTWELYAVDRCGALRHRWFRVSDGWSDWHDMPTPGAVTAIASGSYAEGHQELFIAVEDGTVFHRWQHGGVGWWPWTWMPPAAAPVRALSCAGVRSGTIDLYAVDDGGRVHHRGYVEGGAWTDWTDVAVPGRAVAVTCGTTRTGHHELFVAHDSGEVRHRWRVADGWSAWKEFGRGEPLVAMAAASRKDRKLEVFATTPSGKLLKRWYRVDVEDWSKWSEVDLPS